MRRWAVPLALGIAAWATPAWAASFDCAQAASRVETMICTRDRLSRLDESLAQTYRAALRAAPHPDAVTVEQRDWVHDVRDRCHDETCLMLAYEGRIAQLAPDAAREWRMFRDPGAGIAFAYRSDWTVKPGCRDSRTCVALYDKDAAPGAYRITFEVMPGDLEQVASDKAVFHKGPAGWVAKGRMSESVAQIVTGPGWHGLQAVVDCGTAAETGAAPTAGECLWLVVSNGQRCVVGDTPGAQLVDDDTRRVIQSLRFTEP